MYAKFLVEARSLNVGGGSIFHMSEQNSTTGQRPKVRGNFSKVFININKILKISQKI